MQKQYTPTYVHENTIFSRSRYEIQGRRQPASSGGTEGHSFGVGKQERRGRKVREQGVVGEGAAGLTPHQLGVWESAVSSPSEVRGGAPAAEGFYCATQICIARTCYRDVAGWLAGCP